MIECHARCTKRVLKRERSITPASKFYVLKILSCEEIFILVIFSSKKYGPSHPANNEAVTNTHVGNYKVMHVIVLILVKFLATIKQVKYIVNYFQITLFLKEIFNHHEDLLSGSQKFYFLCKSCTLIKGGGCW